MDLTAVQGSAQDFSIKGQRGNYCGTPEIFWAWSLKCFVVTIQHYITLGIVHLFNLKTSGWFTPGVLVELSPTVNTVMIMLLT